MYKISIYGCAMFKKLVCQWVKISPSTFMSLSVAALSHRKPASVRSFRVFFPPAVQFTVFCSRLFTFSQLLVMQAPYLIELPSHSVAQGS